VDLKPTTKRKEQPRVLHGGSAQTRSIAGVSTLCGSNDVCIRDPHCEVMLSGRNNHTRVESMGFFVPNWICLVGMVIWHVMLCNTLVLWGWSVINPGVCSGGTSNCTILPQ